jgi:predicted metalloprotease
MPAMRIAIVLLTLVALPASGADDYRDRALRCEEVKQKIRRIQSKMRAGYTRAQGEKMEEELRRLRALRAKACR